MSDGARHPTTLIAEVTLPEGTAAPFMGRRVLGALLTDIPSSRAVDASLLVSEVVTLMYEEDTRLTMRIEELGRRVRISVLTPASLPEDMDELAGTLLDRLSDGWGWDESGIWFEVETLRRHALTHLPDEELFALAPADKDARDEIYSRYAGWAATVANRYRRPGAHFDDVGQAASIGLVNAIDRFDPAYGVKFTTFARKTIVGTLKRYLRDTTWSVRVPRALSDTAVEVNWARGELEQRLGRAPGTAELAEELGRSAEEVEVAEQAALAYRARSVEAPTTDEERSSLVGVLGSEDEQFDLADIWYTLEPLISDLEPEEREVLFLRFFEDMTQTDIAEVVGVSQMQVSRLISRALERLRVALGADKVPVREDR